MVKPLLPKADFNLLFSQTQLKVIKIGKTTAFDETEKYQNEVKEYPHFIDVEVINCSIAEQTGRTFRIKLHKLNELAVGDTLTIASDQYQLLDSTVTWYSTKGQRYGHDWYYVNISVKGRELIESA